MWYQVNANRRDSLTQSDLKFIQHICLLIPSIHLSVISFVSIILALMSGSSVLGVEKVSILNYLFLCSPVFLLFNVFVFIRDMNPKKQTNVPVFVATVLSSLFLFSISILDSKVSLQSFGYLILCAVSIYAHRMRG